MRFMRNLITLIAAASLSACASAPQGGTAEEFLSDIRVSAESSHEERASHEERISNLETALVGLADQLGRVTQELIRVRDGAGAEQNTGGQ